MIPPAAVVPGAVLIDVEGTTTPIRFVHNVLFPYARAGLAGLLADHGHEADVAEALAEVPGPDRLATLLAWMDNDTKATPLKALQGIVWRHGYSIGELKGELYPDVAPCLRRWAAAGLRLCVYSSGSVEAQRQLFGHSVAGDLIPLFTGFFDTRVGAKREPQSYVTIAQGLFLPGSEILFLSDIEAELDAAAAAGLRTCQLVRAMDGTIASVRHPTAEDFRAVARQFGLPNIR